MSILSDEDIRAKRDTGEIVIEPFSECNLGNCSYDVTLGEWYYAHPPSMPARMLNPWDSSAVAEYWGGDPKRATKAREGDGTDLKPGTRYIPIPARATILAHTVEFVGGLRDITTEMRTRSSLGRVGINTCKCAGWGDVGYINRWTMEITNYLDWTVVLPVGARVAQVIFMRTGHTDRLYGEDCGKYQPRIDCAVDEALSRRLERLQNQWVPSMMLPRLGDDVRKT